MTRALLQWSDLRPTLHRAVGRSGNTYELASDDGCRELWVFPADHGPGKRIDTGWLADMKARADMIERDAIGHAPPTQRIAWTKIKPGHYWGLSEIGPAYRVLSMGRQNGEAVWRLERFENQDSEYGSAIDEGSLHLCKRRAVEDATEAARARTVEAAA